MTWYEQILPPLIAAVPLFAVAIWGIKVAIRTLNTIAAQTTAIQKQTDTLINSERAWVLGAAIGKIEEFKPDPNKVQLLWVTIPIQNFGKTQARIIRAHVRQHQILKNESLPIPPQYQEAGGCDFVLPPNIPAADLTLSIIASDFLAIWRGEKVLYLYGFIDYKIIGEEEKRTRFCYKYHVQSGFNPQVNGFYPDLTAPRAYTECT